MPNNCRAEKNSIDILISSFTRREKFRGVVLDIFLWIHRFTLEERQRARTDESLE